MIRKVFRLAVAVTCLLSLLASVGTGWLWWRSKRSAAAVEFDWRGGQWEVASGHGRLSVDNEPQRRREAAPLLAAAQETTAAQMRWLIQQDRLGKLRFETPEWARAKAEADALFQAMVAAHDSYTDVRLAMAANPGTPPAGRSVSHAWLVAATALPPLLWLGVYGRRGWNRRRRHRLGLRIACGYDLRGSPAGRCSECGAEISAKGSAT